MVAIKRKANRPIRIASLDNAKGLLHVAKGAGIVLTGKLCGKGLLFLYTVFLASRFTFEEVGLYFLGLTFIGFMNVLASMGLKIGVVRYVSIYSSQENWVGVKAVVLTATIVAAIIGGVMSGLLIIGADAVSALIFSKPKLALALEILSLSIPPTSLMWIFLSVTRGMKIMQYTAIIEEFGLVASRFAFAVGLVLIMGKRFEAILWAYVLSSWICMLLSIYCMLKHLPATKEKVWGKLPIKSLLGFSVPLVFSGILGNLTRQIDIIMIGVFLSAADVGIYSIVVRVVLLAEIVFRVFTVIFNPLVAELHASREFDKMAHFLKLISKWNFAISFPAFLSIIFFPGFFLNFFGYKFVAGAGCLVILSLTHLLGSFSDLPASVIFMSGRSEIILENNIGALMLNTILNFLFIPYFGIMGAAIATGTTTMALAFARIIELYHLMRIHPFSRYLYLPIGVGSTLMAGLVILWKPFWKAMPVNLQYSTFVGLIAFSLIYFIVICSFRLSQEETYVRGIIRQRLFPFLKFKFGGAKN